MALQAAPRVGPAAGSDPRETLIAAIVQSWADILRIERIGPDDDFFALGGTSLGVVAAVALIGERVGIDVPPHVLFAAPTPAGMAERIAELRAASAMSDGGGTTPFFPDWLVPLQPEGGGWPVFVFPGGRGGPMLLAKDAQIARMVGRAHPFYGFRRDPPHIAPGRDDWIPALAADYVAQVRSIQPRGPYALYGICSGGALAWEAARQLIELGEAVDSLLFYESPLAADFDVSVSDEVSLARRFSENMPPYVPTPLEVDLTVLMTSGWQARGQCAGWHRVVRGQTETAVMPGDTEVMKVHNLYMKREAMIAGHVAAWIARTEARRAARGAVPPR